MAVITFCQNEPCSSRSDLVFLASFIENGANNVIKSPSRHRYSTIIEHFAFVLYMLGASESEANKRTSLFALIYQEVFRVYLP